MAVGSVIGRGGETIKRIQAETGARMQFDAGEEQEEEGGCVCMCVCVYIYIYIYICSCSCWYKCVSAEEVEEP